MKSIFKSNLRFVFIPVVAVALIFLVGFVIMNLWNYVLPALFGIKPITLWQAMALFFLCKILFGFGGGPKGGGSPWRERARWRKFQQMSEADKARFRAHMRHRSCWWDESDKRPDNRAASGDNIGENEE